MKDTLSFLPVALVCLSCSAVYAAGFQIQEQSVKALGNALAGGAAYDEDAAVIFFNPAGMSFLQAQRQASLGAHGIIPQVDFNDANSTDAIGGPAVGDRGVDAGQIAAVPNAYLALPITDRLSIGLGLSSYYGLVTDYDDDWIGRYHAVTSQLLTFALNPAVSYKVSGKFAVGAGFTAQYADAELSNALDFGTLGFLAGAPVSPSTPTFDGFTKVEGDGWGYGFNLGLQYRFDTGTRVGLAYRSEIEHTLEGVNTLTIPDFAVPSAGASRTRSAEADFSTPATLSLSAFHPLSERWAVMADVTWTDWSAFDELRIEFDDGSADSVQPHEWDDSFRYSFGLRYAPRPDWAFRLGLAYDETPVPSAELRTPRIPDSDRMWLALGASYRLSAAFSVDVAYAHIFFDRARILNTEVTTSGLAGMPVGSTLDGEYEGRADIIGAQLQWNF